jgi:hypothetical protein
VCRQVALVGELRVTVLAHVHHHLGTE